MSYAQNIFTTTSPNETNFVITWTAPYYMTTADVKAEVDNASAAIDKVAWTVVSVSGTNVTLATGIPTDSTVRIYRETDVSSNEVDFLAGSPFRAGDVNLNFDQTLFAIQEALTSDENHEADIDRLEGLIDTILALLNNNIQFVQVANVAALDTAAATDPDNLKGYEVVDSTGLEGANPEIPLLPPKAGTGTGEDPVTGVYWDSGISTKVLWDKANQNWIYVSYFASNGDNRYQQITLQQATAPVLANFKNGTLWFNTTDQNLYVLYDDAGTRSWVLVGPLRDDRYVNRTGDSMTGDLLMNNADVVFEGSTDDGFETTLTVTDPTADNSIVLPDVSGNVVTTGDTGTVTSTMIADGTIVDADINASAAITLTKLGSGALPSNITVNSDNITNLSIVNDDVNANAEIEVSKLANGTARQLLQTDAAGTGVEFTSNVDVPGTLDVTSTAVFDSNVGIRVTSPNVDLEVNDTFRVSRDGSQGTYLELFGGSSSTDPYLNVPSGFGIPFQINGSEKMRIDSSGKVGIGTTSPNTPLHIKGGFPTTTVERNTGATGAASLGLTNSTNSGFLVTGSDTDFTITASTGVTAGTGLSERLRIDSSGRLLVGVSSSSADTRAIIQGRSASSDSTGKLFISSGNNAPGNGDGIAELNFSSSAHVASARIAIQRDAGTWTAGSSLPTRLTFSTTADGASSPTERMRIDSLGNVGIGTTAPTYYGASFKTLEISGTNGNDGGIFSSVTADNAVKAYFYTDSSSDTARIGTVTNHPFLFSTNTLERMRIDSSGRVGIGTTSPSHQLTVHNASTTSGTIEANRFSVRNNFGSVSGLGNGFVSPAANTLAFATSSTERMRLTTNGVMKLSSSGTYSTNASTAKNHEIRNDNNGWDTIYVSSPNAEPYGIQINLGTVKNNSTNYFLYCGDTAKRLQINSNGGIQNYQGNNLNLCDEREKKNIVSLNSKWEKVKSWELKKFHYNEDADTDDLRYGVIAQQVENVCPEVLTTWEKQKAADAVLDEDGNVVEPAKEAVLRKGVKEQQMMWMAIKALQEAMAKIETLEAKVAALEAG